ncbi:MAG: LysM peptidoglycan-binding domain-containing protein [Halanaerobiales bacterium]
MNKRIFYVLLTFVIIISISNVGMASTNLDYNESSKGIEILAGNSINKEADLIFNRDEVVNISREKAGEILHDYLSQSYAEGDLKPISENPLIEIVGFKGPTSTQVYYVKRGDSLYEIARKFDTSVDAIKRLNNMSSNYLYVGQKLEVSAANSELVYYVKSGDSLYKLAREYNTTVSFIRERNNLSRDYLYVGQELILPVENIDSHYTYSVKPGDSLYEIASKYGTSIQEIRRINNLYSNYLYVGQELRIPVDVIKEGIGQRVNINDQEMDLMARAVYSEARGEPYEGQVAIAAVVINRILHPLFPNTVSGVIFQPWQFTAVHDGQFWLEPNKLAYQASRAALDGWDPTGGAIYYYNPVTATSRWVFYRQVIIKIGQHYFAI